MLTDDQQKRQDLADYLETKVIPDLRAGRLDIVFQFQCRAPIEIAPEKNQACQIVGPLETVISLRQTAEDWAEKQDFVVELRPKE